MKCPHCHSDNPIDATQCGSCGSPLPSQARSSNPHHVIEDGLDEIRSMKNGAESIGATDVFAGLIADNARRSAETEVAQKSESTPRRHARHATDPTLLEKDIEAEDIFTTTPKSTERDSLVEVVEDIFPAKEKPAIPDAVKIKRPNSDVTADFTGLETLVDSSYVPPTYQSAGDTMEFPNLDSAGAPRVAARFRSDDSKKELKRQKKAQKKLDKQRLKEQRKRDKELEAAGAKSAQDLAAGAVVGAAAGVATAQAAGSSQEASWQEGQPISQAIPVSSDPLSSPSQPDGGVVDSFEAWDRDFEAVEPVVDGATELPYDPIYESETINWEEFDSSDEPIDEGVPFVDTHSDDPAITAFVATEPDSASTSQNYRTPQDTPRSKLPLIVGIIVAVLIAAGIIALVTYNLELWGGKIVPNVVDQTEADAASELEAAGFTVRVTQVKSDDTEGIVLLTDPEGDHRAPEGSEVMIAVSVPRYIPEGVGKSHADAAALLDAEDFESITYTEQRSNEPEGTVLAITPDAGTQAKSNTLITVTVAVPFYVPSVEGMDQAAATTTLEDAGYEVSVQTSYTEDVAEGPILGTDPSAGEQYPGGSTVTLLVAKSRANECLSFAQTYFQSAPNNRFTYDVNGGVLTQVKPETLAVDYVGDSTVSYRIVAQAVTGGIFGLFQSLGQEETISGTLTFDEKGNVISSTPQIKRNR